MKKHIFSKFGGEDLLMNPLLLDPSKTDGFTKATDAANIDTYRTGILAKRLGKEQQGPDITGTAFSQTADGSSITLGAAAPTTVGFFQKFTPSTGFPIFRIAGQMRWVIATKPDNLVCKLYSSTAGLPDAVLATSTTVTESSVTVPTTGFAKISFVFPSPYSVLPGTDYWFSFEFTKATGAVNIIIDAAGLSSFDVVTRIGSASYSAAIEKDLWYEVNTGVVQGIYDFRFSIDCDAPSSLVLVAIDGGVYFSYVSGGYAPTKYGGISPDALPPLGSGTFAEDYLTATPAERIYTFITDSGGTMSNGDPGYVITP